MAALQKYIFELCQRWGKAILPCICVFTLLFLGGCNPQQFLNQAPSDFEAQVLQVIRDNPEVLLESVQNYQQQQQQQQEDQQQQAVSQVGQQLRTNPDPIIGNSPQRGSKDKRLVLLEFSDFQCPFCARAHTTVQRFMDAYGQDVTLVYKHLPLSTIHPQALPAAKAAWAAYQQGKFWEFHDALFTNQKRLGDEFYLETAERLQLDINQFNRDRNSRAADAAITADLQLAEQLGLGGTPFFLLNDIPISGARPLQDFENALSEAKRKLG
ncbi:MAG: thioredoxin domain-containing protein [Synechococcaceae cyanobacterium SM2_3_1]|nr:thioredoxin domain-containing protein [Synechococcaceae cyanobacterium SM2_3_1]